ncbi:hypothetical protein ES703_12229 [subsurface metagenome]
MKKKNKSMLLREKGSVYKINRNTITIPVIEKIVEKVVNRKLQELLKDPDYGLELQKNFKQKLNLILRKRKKTIPEAKIAKKYGVRL